MNIIIRRSYDPLKKGKQPAGRDPKLKITAILCGAVMFTSTISHYLAGE